MLGDLVTKAARSVRLPPDPQSGKPGLGSSLAMCRSAARRMPARPPAQNATRTAVPKTQRPPPMRHALPKTTRVTSSVTPGDLEANPRRAIFLSPRIDAKLVPALRRYVSR